MHFRGIGVKLRNPDKIARNRRDESSCADLSTAVCRYTDNSK